ncbi:MAG: BTAD domain-containing putative transcriptional regulator, partial [Anaerolineales bacterium]
LLWGDLPETNARRNLRRALWDLRRRLAPLSHRHPERVGKNLSPFILSTKHTAAFNQESNYWLDVEAFERIAGKYASLRAAEFLEEEVVGLSEAVDLYRGDLLDGFHISKAPSFEEWLLVERERLRTLALVALERLATHHTTRGEHQTALVCARRLLALDPWREGAHRQLMQLLTLTGQRGAALAQYETCRRILLEELGIVPTEETSTLYERIRAGKWGSMGTMETGRQSGIVSPQHPRTPPPPLPFVGRGEAYASLISGWERARQGRGKLTLIEGEAGIGKTRLVEEAARYAEVQGAVLLRGRCYEFGGGVPYQSIADALRSTFNLQPPTPNLQPDVWLAELSRLLPDLRKTWPNLPDPVQVTGEAARQRLFEAVARFLLALVETSPNHAASLLLFLDDLHWADQSTLDLLHYLTRRLTAAPIWIVGTYRPEEVDLSHPLTRLWQGLERDALVDRLILEPLSAGAVKKLTRALVGHEQSHAGLGAFLHRESEGNPFILVETMTSLQESGALRQKAGGNLQWDKPPEPGMLPASVQGMILQRVGRLSEQGGRLLKLAAVIGRQFPLQLLQIAALRLHSGDAVEDVVSPIEEWLARRLVREASNQYSVFSNFITRHKGEEASKSGGGGGGWRAPPPP